ncbi:hypothetical protein V5T82_16945 [Magnetovibrio sp. PR-2]|uniref:hypothetical protein n=1 Tax=Magnetovibrio sp. PR-2 TaxID=3120356 RepID=UPI002FCDE3BB
MSVNLTPQRNERLDRYRVDGQLYTIGTSAGRVGFHAQQWRALDLVSNLIVDLQSVENPEVGVLGAGVSGTVCFTALKALGVKNVKLIEAHDDILQQQATAEHRHAHPSYNDWPIQLDQGREYLSTTNLPFMNWYADNVKEITEQIKEDENFASFCKENSDDVLTSHTITNIRLDKMDDRIYVTADHPLKRNKRFRFDFTIIALGFGREKHLHLSSSGSYWWSDNVKNYRSDHLYADLPRYVTGKGDGGLIDYVRLALKEGNVLDKNETNPALEVIGLLRKEEYQKLDNAWPEKNQQATDAEKHLAECFAPQEGEPNPQNFYNFMHRLCTENSHYPGAEEIQKMIERNFKRAEELDRIHLVGDGDTPFNEKVSPVNALLYSLFYTSNENERYKQGGIEDNRLQINGEPVSEKHIHFTRTGSQDLIEGLLVGEDLKEKYTKLLAERGVNNDLIFEWERIFVNIPVKFDSNKRLDLAEKFLRRYFNNADIYLEPDETFVVCLPEDDSNDNVYKKLGGFDRQIFGVGVKYEFRHACPVCGVDFEAAP